MTKHFGHKSLGEKVSEGHLGITAAYHGVCCKKSLSGKKYTVCVMPVIHHTFSLGRGHKPSSERQETFLHTFGGLP